MAAPYTILTQSQVTNHIVNFWLGVNAAILSLQSQGFQVWMPTSVDFEAMLIDQPQQLAVIVSSGGNEATVQTGTDTTVHTGTVGDSSTQTTTHGETNSTTDQSQTEYQAADLAAALTGPTYLQETYAGTPFPF
jgi:hypothetical protein